MCLQERFNVVSVETFKQFSHLTIGLSSSTLISFALPRFDIAGEFFFTVTGAVIFLELRFEMLIDIYNIKFSIIVPVYNVEKYIKKCINSILNQTYKNYEIIIINDGSTDKSKKILESYKNIDNIKIINQTNKGLSVARNIGIKNASGDYLLFVDSDDYIDNDLLENLNKNITDEEIIRFQTRTVDESYKVLKEYNEMPFDTTTGNEALVYILKYRAIN